MFTSLIILISFLFCRAMRKTKKFVHTKRVTFMQRISDRVKDGYFEYVFGICVRDKFHSLFDKFNAIYSLDISKDQRYRRRKNGEAVYSLVACTTSTIETSDIQWVLLRTAGKPTLLADKRELWHDVRDARMILFERYELHRHTRKEMSSPSWSWRIEKMKYSNIREDVILSIRRKFDKKLDSILHDLVLMPKFAPIRKQILDIQNLIKSEFKRSRSKDEIYPDLPRIGYARRLKDNMVKI